MAFFGFGGEFGATLFGPLPNKLGQHVNGPAVVNGPAAVRQISCS